MSYEVKEGGKIDEFLYGNIDVRAWSGNSIQEVLSGKKSKGFLAREQKGKLKKDDLALLSTSDVPIGQTQWLSIGGKKVEAMLGFEPATEDMHEPQDAAGAMILPYTDRQGKYQEILVAAFADGVSMVKRNGNVYPARDSGKMATAAVKRSVAGIATLIERDGHYNLEDVYRVIQDKFTRENLSDGSCTLNIIVAFPHKSKPGHLKVHCHTLSGKKDNGPVMSFDRNGAVTHWAEFGQDRKVFFMPGRSPGDLIDMTKDDAWTIPPGSSIGFGTDGLLPDGEGDDKTLLKITAK